MERAAAGEVPARLTERHPGGLRQRDQRHLLLQPLDLRLGDARHAALRKNHQTCISCLTR